MVMGPGGSGEVTKGQEDWARAAGRQWLGLDPSRDKTPEKSPEVRPKWGCPHSNPMQHAAAELTFPMLPAAPPLHPLPNKHNPKFLSCHLQPCPPPAPPTPTPTPAKRMIHFHLQSSIIPLSWLRCSCCFLHWNSSSRIQTVCLNPAFIHSSTELPPCQVHLKSHLNKRKKKTQCCFYQQFTPGPPVSLVF